MTRSSTDQDQHASDGLAVAAAIGLVAVGCGSSSKSHQLERHRRPKTTATAQASIGAGEGQLDIIAWAGYAENGANDPSVNWVGEVRDRLRLQGQRQGRQHLRRDGAAHADGPVRRRVGVG